MGGHEHKIDWRALLFYGVASVTVLVVGSTILYSYFEKQTLVSSIAAEPLPKVAVVTGQADSKFCAAWVAMLTQAEFAATLVPVDRFAPTDSLVALCDLSETTPALRQHFAKTLADAGGALVLGRPPVDAPPLLGLKAAVGTSDQTFRFTDAVSPLLARVTPGHELGVTPRGLALLEETPEMLVDARWMPNSRAAAVHFHHGPGRVIWFGFDPAALHLPKDRQLSLFLRTSLRWAAGQPISEGAIGPPTIAKAMTPDARNTARAKRLTFSVDRLRKPGLYSLRMVNRGKERLENPTIKFWLPPKATKVDLIGSWLLRRRASIVGVPDDHSVIITIPTLGPYQQRVMKLRAE